MRKMCKYVVAIRKVWKQNIEHDDQGVIEFCV